MSCEVLNKIGTGDCERKTLHCKSDPSLAKILASELVSEIIENALDIVEERDDKRSKKVVGDIVDTITKSFNTMQIIEENTKHSEKEVCCTVSSKGVGDQLKANREVITAESPVRHPPVEKKNRLTDLVKNSKHILAKLILNENKEVLESQPEEVIRVVELDSGDKSFKANRKILPENVPLPRNDSREILGNIDEKMDEIELFEPKERSGAGNGEDLFKKTMTFPLDRSGKPLGFAARCRTLKFPQELKKKKWNIGSKLINYIRKHKKDEKVKEGGSVEFQPNPDNE